MQLREAIETRKSVRRYSDKKPDWKKIIRAIDSARFAPIAGNLSSLKFLIISDLKQIQQLKEASQQDFVGEAQYAVIVVSDDSKLKKLYGDRAETFARQQAGAAIQNFLLALTELKLATCWVGYFDDRLVKRAADIPDNLFVEGIFPIGFETKIKTPKKPKPDLENLTYFNKYGSKSMHEKVMVSSDAV